VLLRQAGKLWEVVADESTLRLFSPLPLVDTHDLPFGFAVVGSKFKPIPQRNGIEASAAGKSGVLTEANWTLLRRIPALFEQLVGSHSHTSAFVENGQEQLLEAGRFLMETSGTRPPFSVLGGSDQLRPSGVLTPWPRRGTLAV
jgi:hypothetical protein